MEDQLTPEQRSALWRFAERHGRRWRSKLRYLWYSGKDLNIPDAPLLRQIRNTHALDLDKIRLEK